MVFPRLELYDFSSLFWCFGEDGEHEAYRSGTTKDNVLFINPTLSFLTYRRTLFDGLVFLQFFNNLEDLCGMRVEN